MEVDQPPASTVRRFLALLEQSDIDFSEELGEIVIYASGRYMYLVTCVWTLLGVLHFAIVDYLTRG